MRAFTGGGGDALGPLFSNAAAYSDTLQRDQLSRVALSVGTATTDDLDALIADLEADRADLADKLEAAEALTETIAEAQAATVELTAEYHEPTRRRRSRVPGGDRRGRGPSGRPSRLASSPAMPPPRRPTPPPQPWPPHPAVAEAEAAIPAPVAGQWWRWRYGWRRRCAGRTRLRQRVAATAGRLTGQLSRAVVARRHGDRRRPIGSWVSPTSATRRFRVSDSTARVSRRTRGGRPACTCRTSHAPRRRSCRTSRPAPPNRAT